MDVRVSGKDGTGKKTGRRTSGSPRKEQGGGEGRAGRQMSWVPDVDRGLKGLPVPLGLGFPFPTLGRGRGAAVPNLKGRTKDQGLQLGQCDGLLRAGVVRVVSQVPGRAKSPSGSSHG